MDNFRIIRTPQRRELRQRQTEAERIFWIYLRRFRETGYIFRRQHSIDRYVVDFYCPKAKLAIELDGTIHDTAEQKIKDKYRDSVIKSYGIEILRIKNKQILDNPEDVMKLIREILEKLSLQK